MRGIPELKDYIPDIGHFILLKTGLYFPESRRTDLEKALVETIQELSSGEPDIFCRRLLSNGLSDREMDVLVSHLTVGETYFFRDPALFQVLREQIFTPLQNGTNRLFSGMNIWSAGCCSGEEPYSIAMLIDRFFPVNSAGKTMIFGTDINARFLEKARSGVYTRWSLRNTQADIARKYFTQKENDRFELSSRIRSRVQFQKLNLKSPDWPSPFNRPSAMNLILFRNVLMYFDSKTIEYVIDRLYNCLADEGWLVVSPSETAFVKHPGLTPVNFPGVVFHRKGKPRQKMPETNKFHQVSKKNAVPAATQKIFPLKKRRKTDHNIKETGPKLDAENLEKARTLFHDKQYQACEQQLLKMINSHKITLASELIRPKVLNLLSRVSANLGKFEKALEFCLKVVTMEKLNPDHRYLLATIYNSLDDIENERKALDQTLYLDPDYVLAHVQMGMLAKKENQLDLSKKHLNIAKQLLRSMDPDKPLTTMDTITADELLHLISTDT